MLMEYMLWTYGHRRTILKWITLSVIFELVEIYEILPQEFVISNADTRARDVAVLLTAHLSIILAIDQPNAQSLVL